MCTHPAAPECFHVACLGDSLSHILLRHDSFIYMLWKAGRPADWRHSKALSLVWEFPSSIFSLNQNFLTCAVIMAVTSGGSCWLITSKFAAFQRRGEIVLWEIIGEKVGSCWYQRFCRGSSYSGRERNTKMQTMKKPDERNLLVDYVSVAQQPRPVAS